jgi:hypothetical protein
VTFWYGTGSADPYDTVPLTNGSGPALDPAIFIRDLKTSTKNYFTGRDERRSGGGGRMPMRTKNLASEEKSPGYATPKSRLVPGQQNKQHLSIWFRKRRCVGSGSYNLIKSG